MKLAVKVLEKGSELILGRPSQDGEQDDNLVDRLKWAEGAALDKTTGTISVVAA